MSCGSDSLDMARPKSASLICCGTPSGARLLSVPVGFVFFRFKDMANAERMLSETVCAVAFVIRTPSLFRLVMMFSLGIIFVSRTDMAPAHHAARSTIFVHQRAALVVCRPAMIPSKMIPVPQSWAMVWESVTSETGIG